MDKQAGTGAYQRPAIEDFGSLWDNTFLNPGTTLPPKGRLGPDRGFEAGDGGS